MTIYKQKHGKCIMDTVQFSEFKDRFDSNPTIKSALSLGIMCYNSEEYTLAINYYTEAAGMGSGYACGVLGHIYMDKLHEPDTAIYYYNIGIERGVGQSANNLGVYHVKIKNNLDTARNYFKLAIGFCEAWGAINLGDTYRNAKDYEKAMYYYKIGVKLNSGVAAHRAAMEYRRRGENNKSLKYIAIGADLGDKESLYLYGEACENCKWYIEAALAYIDCERYEECFELITTKEFDIDTELVETLSNIKMENPPAILKIISNLYHKKIDMLDLHFKYAPGGEGFDAAKNDFLDLQRE